MGPGFVEVNPLDLLLEGGRAAPQPRGKGAVLEEELRTRGSRNSVLGQLSGSPRWIITEEVLNSIPDNEAALVCDYCASAASEWGSSVVHMLSPLMADTNQGPTLNWKTYAGWRTWLDTNGFGTHAILPTVTDHDQGVVAYSGLL